MNLIGKLFFAVRISQDFEQLLWQDIGFEGSMGLAEGLKVNQSVFIQLFCKITF